MAGNAQKTRSEARNDLSEPSKHVQINWMNFNDDLDDF